MLFNDLLYCDILYYDIAKLFRLNEIKTII